jgi:hypothetical protein
MTNKPTASTLPKARKRTSACIVLILDNMGRGVFHTREGGSFINADNLVGVLDLGADIALAQDAFFISG